MDDGKSPLAAAVATGGALVVILALVALAIFGCVAAAVEIWRSRYGGRCSGETGRMVEETATLPGVRGERDGMEGPGGGADTGRDQLCGDDPPMPGVRGDGTADAEDTADVTTRPTAEDIVRALAEADPIYDMIMCHFCCASTPERYFDGENCLQPQEGEHWRWGEGGERHDDDCPWWMARQHLGMASWPLERVAE